MAPRDWNFVLGARPNHVIGNQLEPRENGNNCCFKNWIGDTLASDNCDRQCQEAWGSSSNLEQRSVSFSVSQAWLYVLSFTCFYFFDLLCTCLNLLCYYKQCRSCKANRKLYRKRKLVWLLSRCTFFYICW